MPSAENSGGQGTAGTKFREGQLHQIPRPETPEAQQRWQLEQMAGAFRVFARLGFADGSSGHISLRGMLVQRSVGHPAF
jgi:hypothetical protein